MQRSWDNGFVKKAFLLVFFCLLIGVIYIAATRYSAQVRQVPNVFGMSASSDSKSDNPVVAPSSKDETLRKYLKQRNDISVQLNLMKQAYGQQSCEQLKLLQAAGKQANSLVSENGGWCAEASSPDSKSHMWDQGFSTALSKFLQGKTVGSFGDGPGAYKKHLDSLGQVKLYTAYDGAPYCENVTKGIVKFLDLTAPQFGIPAYDWVVSVEVGEHIPAKFEDIYLDNLVRHAKEGLVLSWAVPGQGGLSHVNNKPLVAVIAQLNKRGFDIDQTSGKILRDASSFSWLRGNINVYKRINPSSFVEDDA